MKDRITHYIISIFENNVAISLTGEVGFKYALRINRACAGEKVSVPPAGEVQKKRPNKKQ